MKTIKGPMFVPICDTHDDTLPSPLLDPLEGPSMRNCRRS
jgi:hypothetical protein